MATDLTSGQARCLEAIETYCREHGNLSPSVRDVMRALGLSNPNAVAIHLKALRAKGMITWTPNTARSIRLTTDPNVHVQMRKALEELVEAARGPGIFCARSNPIHAAIRKAEELLG